jgi:hypothetical protein
MDNVTEYPTRVAGVIGKCANNKTKEESLLDWLDSTAGYCPPVCDILLALA